MDDKRIRRKAPLLDEGEQDRRDRLDSLDGADWLKAHLACADESGLARYQADAGLRVAFELGRKWASMADIKGGAQKAPWLRVGVSSVRGNHDKVEEPPNAQPEEGGTAPIPEQTAHDWVGAPALPTAPRMGEVAIGLFSTPAFREAVLGDLAEQFDARAARDGPRSARAWYWWQVVRSFGAFGWRWAQRLAQLQAVLRLIGF